MLTTFILSLFVIKLTQGKYNFALSARIAISIMLLFTALGHFLFTEGMTLMIPEFIPFKRKFVHFTAILEILGAIALHIPNYRLITAWLLITFLIIILPANINASIEELNYQTASYNGKGIMYLWFRIPLQLLFIIWIYTCSIKH